jgi:sortase A
VNEVVEVVDHERTVPHLGSALAARVVEPRPSIREHRQQLQRMGIRVAVLVVVAAVALVVLDALGGGLVYSARQGQLAADFRTPRNYSARSRAIAVLQVPKIDLNVIVVEGVDPPNLRGGPGHLPNSAVPGASGNAVVLGHGDRFGGPFGKLAQLAESDEIYVQPKGTADVIVYKVTKVSRESAEVLAAMGPADETRLTLVTSSGGRFSSDRFVVEATAEAPAQKPPAATAAASAPTSIEPDGHALNLSLIFAFCWLVVGVAILRALGNAYPSRIRWLVGAVPLLLGATMFWFEIDRWLPATI